MELSASAFIAQQNLYSTKHKARESLALPRIASPDDPDIKAAAEIAAEAIMQSERKVQQDKEDAKPKTLEQEISSMV